MGSTTIANFKHIILGVGTYFPPINALSNQKRAIFRGMRTPRELKLRRFADHMIDINEYLTVFPGAKESEKSVRWN